MIVAAEAQKVVKLTVTKIHNSKHFGSLLSKGFQSLKFLNQPCQVTPNRYETCTGDLYLTSDTEDHFCQIYQEILNLTAYSKV